MRGAKAPPKKIKEKNVMRNKKLVGILLAMALIGATTTAAACNLSSGNSTDTGSNPSGYEDPADTGSNPSGGQEDYTVSLPETASVTEFETTTLEVVFSGEYDGTVVWSSSDTGVATVSDGVVSGVKAGTATITATAGDKSASCLVTVNKTNLSHDISLSSEKFTIKADSSKEVTVSLMFGGEPLDLAAEYSWTLSEGDEGVVTVATENGGAKATFTGVKKGTVKYEVSATVRGYDVYAELEITVQEDIYSLQPECEGLTQGENGYEVQITVGESFVLGSVFVYKNGEAVAQAGCTKESSDAEIAYAGFGAEGSVINAEKVGAATITYTFQYSDQESGKTVDLSFIVNVTVVRKEVALGAFSVIETSKNKIVLSGELATETFEKVTIGSCVIDGESLSVSNGDLIVAEGKMPCKMSDLGEGVTIKLQTVDTVYTATTNVYTQIIKTKEELANWEDLACDVAVNAGLCSTKEDGSARRGEYLSGYFILANDIDYNGAYVPKVTFGTHGNLYNWDKDWGDENNFGFKGVFDGKGHIVRGMTISGKFNGFVTTLSNGTIKNISFLDASVSEGANFVVAAGTGTIENIYVKYSKISNTLGERVGTFYVNYNRDSRVIKNVIIDVTDCVFDSEIKNTYLVGYSYGTLENVLVIGEFADNAANNSYLIADGDGVVPERKALHYNSFGELFASDEGSALATALNGDWLSSNGTIILPKAEMDAHAGDVPELAEGTLTSIEKGASITLKGMPYVVYAINEVAGVTLSGNVLTVSEEATVGAEIKVTATSMISGNSSEFTFTVAGKSYVLGTKIEVDGVTLGVVGDGFGLSTIWNKDITDASTIDGANGKVAKFRNDENGMESHAASITLNESIIVADGLNYIKVRMYMESTVITSMGLRFYRSDRTNHQVETDVWNDAEATLSANVWTNVYLDVAKFAVDGKIDGFKFGVFTAGDATVYIDYISGETNAYTLGEVIEMDKITASGLVVSTFGLSNIWNINNNYTTTDVTGQNGTVAYLRNGGGSMASHGAWVKLNTPLTVIDGYNFIKVRMYIVGDEGNTTNFRVYRTDRPNHDVAAGSYTNDYGETITTEQYYNARLDDVVSNEWIDVYFNVSKYAVNGKIEGFGFFIDGGAPTGIYIDQISIELNAYTLGDEMDMDKVTLKGFSNFGLSTFWNNDIIDASIDGASGKVAKFSNGTSSVWAHGNYVSFNNAIVVGDGFNYIKVRMYIQSDEATAMDLRFYRTDRAQHGDGTDGSATINVGEWTDVYLDASKFVVDGKIEGFKFGMFTAGAAYVYIDSVAIVSEKA